MECCKQTENIITIMLFSVSSTLFKLLQYARAVKRKDLFNIDNGIVGWLCTNNFCKYKEGQKNFNRF